MTLGRGLLLCVFQVSTSGFPGELGLPAAAAVGWKYPSVLRLCSKGWRRTAKWDGDETSGDGCSAVGDNLSKHHCLHSVCALTQRPQSTLWAFSAFFTACLGVWCKLSVVLCLSRDGGRDGLILIASQQDVEGKDAHEHVSGAVVCQVWWMFNQGWTSSQPGAVGALGIS